jgi:F0F1-type ATP synthase membrane subunit c/vacuolar-type H+-ATPase subunit K
MTPAILFLAAATLWCALVYEGPHLRGPLRVLVIIWFAMPLAILIYGLIQVLNLMVRHKFRMAYE